MKILSTEFPVIGLDNKAKLVAEVSAWLRGMSRSTVLNDSKILESDQDYINIFSSTGENLQFRVLGPNDSVKAVGFRHEIPEGGTRWRTEGVLDLGGDRHLLRIRTQCIVGDNIREDRVPNKSYIIKTIIKENKAGKDGGLRVGDKLIRLNYSKLNKDWIATVNDGLLTEFLPVVMVLSDGDWNSVLPPNHLKSIAFKLGGLAHVLQLKCEANVGDSLNLNHGKVGIIVPGFGLRKVFYLGGRLRSVDELVLAVENDVKSIRSQMPVKGLDWADIQEQAFAEHRERERKKLSFEDINALYEDEIKSKDERLKEKEEEIAYKNEEIQQLLESMGGVSIYSGKNTIANCKLPWRDFAEFYAGECLDRFGLIFADALGQADARGYDPRTIAFVESCLKNLDDSSDLHSIREELKEAAKNPKQFSAKLKIVLLKYGYNFKSDNGHSRFEPKKEFSGLGSVTLANTPSDKRGMLNTRQQIEAAMGLTKLKK